MLERSFRQEPQARFQRAASWNPYFYRFFHSDQSQVPSGMRPLSGDESCNALLQVVAANGGTHPRPNVLRRCLIDMWATGYRPSPEYRSKFVELAAIATGTERQPDAVKGRRAQGRRNDRSVQRPDEQTLRAAEGLVAADVPPDRTKPSVVTFDGQIWTVKKEYTLDCAIHDITQLLNPMNWHHLAPYFKETRQVEKHKGDDVTGWSGILEETVSINWNGLTLQSFNAFLKVDYTITDKMVRADYSLEYEEENQILVDDGYAEAYRVSAGVTRYTGCKRLKFASSFLNFMAPAALCMFIEQDEHGFRDNLVEQVRVMRNAPGK